GRLRHLVGILLRVFFFFFSSRRRHTRFDCDWSSDVCSSDLCNPKVTDFLKTADNTVVPGPRAAAENNADKLMAADMASLPMWQRSEERRVGKECRARGSPGQYKKIGQESSADIMHNRRSHRG